MEEFERIAGYEVSFEDYNNIIEPMYMALPNVSKQDFVKMIDKKRFAFKNEKQLINEMKKEAEHLRETCHWYTDFDSRDRLNDMIGKYMGRFYLGLDYFINHGYEYPGYRGCSFPKELVICSAKSGKVYKRIQLVKAA